MQKRRRVPIHWNLLRLVAASRKSKLNHRQRHTKKVLVQRFSEYIAIMSFVGRSCLTTVQRFVHAKGLRANPSFEPTRSGRPLQAFISFSALRALPPRAAQLKR